MITGVCAEKKTFIGSQRLAERGAGRADADGVIRIV